MRDNRWTGLGPLVVALLAAVTLVGSCGDPEGAARVTGPASAARAPGGGGKITVSAADPDTVPNDTTLTVMIIGSGFVPGDPDAKVNYLIGGTTGPRSEEVTATAVTVLSPTQIQTTTRVTKTADLGRYSIEVLFTGGKRGVGAEKVEVVAKPVLLPEPQGMTSEALDVNEAGTIVGWFDNGTHQHAVRWNLQGGNWVATDLGEGTASAINSRGEILVHRPADPIIPGGWAISRAHVRLTNNTEVDLGIGAIGAGMSEDGTVVGVVSDGTLGGGTAVLWRRLGEASWAAPIAIPPMPGYSELDVGGISGNGQWIWGSVNNDTGFFLGVVWTWNGISVGEPHFVEHPSVPDIIGSVNNGGGIAGGVNTCGNLSACRSHLAYWPAAGAPRQLTPFGGPSPGLFHDINDQEQMVGYGPVPVWTKGGRTLFTSYRPVLWSPGRPEVVDLGSFRRPRDAVAYAINSTGWVAVGREQDENYDTHAIAWILP